MIEVHRMDKNTYEVTVESSTTTMHEVKLDEDYYLELTQGAVTEEVLIYKSFEFLLERESNTMILRSFHLSVIEKYFPEYRKIIQRRI
jgi:hypothetical protein